MQEQDKQPETNEVNLLNEEIFDSREYDKKVKSAQNAIYFVAAIQFLFGLYLTYVSTGGQRYFVLIIMLIVSISFLGLAIWCKEKPFAAILSALILYGLLLLLDAMEDPVSIFKGIIMKILIIGYLVKGITAAKEAQNMRKIFSGKE